MAPPDRGASCLALGVLLVAALLGADDTSAARPDPDEAAPTRVDQAREEDAPDEAAVPHDVDMAVPSLGGDRKAPTPIRITKPRYPQEAFDDHVEGTVVLEIVITAEGRVEVLRTLESIPPLDEAAEKTVLAWHFEPATLDGKPVATVARAPVTFQISDRPKDWILFPEGMQKLALTKCKGRFASEFLCVAGTVKNTSRTNLVGLVALLSCREEWEGPRVMHEEKLGRLAPGETATFAFEPERCLKGNVLFASRKGGKTELVPTARQRWTLMEDED